MRLHLIRWRGDVHGFGPHRSLFTALNHYGWLYGKIGSDCCDGHIIGLRVGPFGFVLYRSR